MVGRGATFVHFQHSGWGYFYDETSLSAATDLVKDWTPEMVAELRNDVPAQGLNANIAGHKLNDIAKEVLDIARAGLKTRNQTNEDGYDERIFLAPLEETVARGTTPAEEMLHLYNSRWDGDLRHLFEEYSL